MVGPGRGVGEGVVLAVGSAGIRAGEGAGVAVAVMAVEEAVAIGFGVGGFGQIGGAVGRWLGAGFGRKTAQNMTGTSLPGPGDEWESGAGCSDQETLLRGGETWGDIVGRNHHTPP